MRRMLLVLAVTAGMLVLTPGTSWACSCVTSTTAEQAQRADTVVDGTLSYVTTNGIERTYGVSVTGVYKGRSADFEKLVSNANEASCGLGDLATGKRYLFFISGEHPGRMRVGLCGGSTLYDARVAAAIAAVTGPPTVPSEIRQPPRGPVDEDPIAGTAWYTAVGTTLVLAAVLVGLIWLRRSSTRKRSNG